MRPTVRRTGCLACLTVILLLSGCDGSGNEPAAPEETPLNVTLLRQAMQQSLQGTDVHLNNYGREGEERDKSWHRADDSFIRLSPALGGAEVRFNIPESRTDRGPFRFLYYVNDVNVMADSITVSAADDPQDLRLLVRLPFEQEGTEFKGHCLDTSLFGGGCLGSKDRLAPDVHLEDASVIVTLHPVVVDGDLSLEAEDVRFDGAVRAGGVCRVDLGFTAFDLCETIAGYEAQIRSQMETTVLNEVNRPDLRAQIAMGLRPFLDALGIGEVVFVYKAGEDLVIGHYPRP